MKEILHTRGKENVLYIYVEMFRQFYLYRYDNNLEKRIEEHISKDKKGAKYTKSHEVIKLEIAWKSKDKSLACKLEYQIKNLTKQQKENLIKEKKLSTYFKGKIDCRRYRIFV